MVLRLAERVWGYRICILPWIHISLQDIPLREVLCAKAKRPLHEWNESQVDEI
jgi:hypothetical protein